MKIKHLYAEALALLVKPGSYVGTVNVASGESIRLDEVARILTNQYLGLSSGATTVFEESPENGNPLYWKADIGVLKSLGFEPRVSISDGLTQYANWAFTSIE